MRILMSQLMALGFLAVLTFGANGPAWSADLSGQVSQNQMQADKESFPGAVTKSLTLTPGSGAFSGDHLRYGRQVAITLYNPNPYSMRFDTVQRIGKEYSWIVPANSYRTVAFRYFNPVSDEVRFLTYQDPDSLMVSQGTVTQRSVAAAVETPAPVSIAAEAQPTPAQNIVTPPPTQAQEPMKTEAQSAVRGYW